MQAQYGSRVFLRPVALALVLLVTSGGWATAGAQRCLVVTDRVGDARPLAPGTSSAPELDLIDARPALRAGALTVRIAVRPGDAASPTTGQRWSLELSNGERAVELIATRGPDGVAFDAYGGADSFNKPWLGTIEGTVDIASGVIIMRAPLAQLGLRPTNRFSTFSAGTGSGVVTTGEPLESTPVSGTPVSLRQSTSSGTDQAQARATRSLDQLCRR